MMRRSVIATLALACAAAAVVIPAEPLKNAAVPGLSIPYTGLGTGGYGSNATDCYTYPETWADAKGCGESVKNATARYIQIAASLSSSQIRIDNANTYQDVDNVGLGIALSGVPRSRVFLLSKTGSGQAMGYNDTMDQIDALLSQGGVAYVDALLIHWPTSTAASAEPACNAKDAAYNATECRLQTWRAYVDAFNAGKALSIGVSNYYKAELEEIRAAGLIMPAINQVRTGVTARPFWGQDSALGTNFFLILLPRRFLLTCTGLPRGQRQCRTASATAS